MTQSATRLNNANGRKIPAEEWNIIQHDRALRELSKQIFDAISKGLPGQVGIRIPLQKRDGEIRLGNLHMIHDTER